MTSPISRAYGACDQAAPGAGASRDDPTGLALLTPAPLRELARAAAMRLSAAGIEGARREAWLLLGLASGRSRAQLVAHGEAAADPEVTARLESLLARRLAREPLTYIVGEKEFWSLPFRVGPGVLVPRPETETVVEAVLDRLPDRRAALRVLDLGTGSGCLLLALLTELPEATGLGVDLDPGAVAFTRENARALGLESRALVVRGSWGEALAGPFDVIVSNPPYVRHGAWQGLPPEIREHEPERALLAERSLIVRGAWGEALTGPFDVIVSNPPYVRNSDWPELAPEIREHEPDRALLAGADGLDAYRVLAPDLARLLRNGGLACLEHGDGQADEVGAIMLRAGLREIERRRDLAGQERALLVGK